MSITILGADGAPFDQNSIMAMGDRFIKTLVRLVLSGNYPTGGDLLDLTNGGGSPAAPSVVPVAQSRGIVNFDIRPFSRLTTSFSAIGGQYELLVPGAVVPIPFSAVNSLRLKLVLLSGEYANGAYAADALGDFIQAEIYWAR